MLGSQSERQECRARLFLSCPRPHGLVARWSHGLPSVVTWIDCRQGTLRHPLRRSYGVTSQEWQSSSIQPFNGGQPIGERLYSLGTGRVPGGVTGQAHRPPAPRFVWGPDHQTFQKSQNKTITKVTREVTLSQKMNRPLLDTKVFFCYGLVATPQPAHNKSGKNTTL